MKLLVFDIGSNSVRTLRVTQDALARVKAGDLVNFVAQQVGGKGGGRADMAQAGGTDPSKLPQALAAVPEWVSTRV